ncbi:hypothetical protein KC345_g118 [Hortaea werneckii]|nr:hypothetical protein KC345_g118 [Hortaea werneckii]
MRSGGRPQRHVQPGSAARSLVASSMPARCSRVTMCAATQKACRLCAAVTPGATVSWLWELLRFRVSISRTSIARSGNAIRGRFAITSGDERWRHKMLPTMLAADSFVHHSNVFIAIMTQAIADHLLWLFRSRQEPSKDIYTRGISQKQNNTTCYSTLDVRKYSETDVRVELVSNSLSSFIEKKNERLNGGMYRSILKADAVVFFPEMKRVDALMISIALADEETEKKDNSKLSADPLPDPPNIATPPFPDHRPDVRIPFHLPLHPLPDFLPPRRAELLPQHVVPKLGHANVVLTIAGRIVGMQGGLLRQLLQRLSRKRLRLLFLLPAPNEFVTAVRRAAEDREERYKLPKILSKCLSEVSGNRVTYPSVPLTTSSAFCISPRALAHKSSNSSFDMPLRLRVLMVSFNADSRTSALLASPHSYLAFCCLSSSTARSFTADTFRAFALSGSQLGGSGSQVVSRSSPQKA